MTRRCKICNQPIHNTPYHHNLGNKDRCQKHCNCSLCAPASAPAQDRDFSEHKADDDGMAPILPILAAELAADVFSSAPDTSTPDVSTPDPAPDFGGFGGGDSGGGGVSGDF